MLSLLFFIGVPLCFAYVVAGVLTHVYEPLSSVWNLLKLGFYVIVALLLSFLVTLVMGGFLVGIFWPLFRPLYEARCRKNGAPFHVGDRVRILVGRNKDRVTRVYSDWRDDCVRVELGEEEKEEFKDIFSIIQLVREDAESGSRND
ncbi:MAG: hypothetical protein H0X66_02285 [Verrucomicrobia bacterium]|nr:hypothetical protein [Verrucomicrobiota bacterium]